MKVVSGRGPYFAQIPFALLDDPKADAATIATYCALRRFTDFGSDQGCRAGLNRLAKTAGLGRSALWDRLQRLKEMGWVEWDPGVGKPSRYRVHASLDPSATRTTPVRSADDHPSATRTQPRDSNQETKTEISKPAAWVRSLSEDWTKTYGGIPNCGELGKRLKPLVEEHGFEPVREHWQNYLEATEGRFASPSRFAQTYGSWDRAGGAPAQEGRISKEEARAAFHAAGIPDSWAVNPEGYESREQLNVALAARLAKLTGALV